MKDDTIKKDKISKLREYKYSKDIMFYTNVDLIHWVTILQGLRVALYNRLQYNSVDSQQ